MATHLGFDLSSSGLKCVAVTTDLKVVHESAIVFDVDLPHYGVVGGVHKNEAENEVYAPVAMWIEALDLLLTRMKDAGFDFNSVSGISGAGQQHGSVFWSEKAETILANLKSEESLAKQLDPDAFTHPWSPNWQDHSTQKECDEFENTVKGDEELAKMTGSKAHHRFTGPQIKRFIRLRPEVYERTSRISLVSSFLCSLFLGRVAPIDISDVCGMNLWNMQDSTWDSTLLSLTASGSPSGGEGLATKLGNVEHTPGKHLGNISPYFTTRFGFAATATITPFTGDNPSTILALPLRPMDVIVSLGTSTTLLMVTPSYKPSPEFHLFNHPTTKGLYMFMLCYCNGAGAREAIRTSITPDSNSWDAFSSTALSTPPLGRTSGVSKLGLFFPLPEIVPHVAAGTWRYVLTPSGLEAATPETWDTPKDDARAILESQALSMRLRSAPLLGDNGRPRRVYVVGGGSKNPAITNIVASVLGGEGVYQLDIGGNACALGAAYYAAWAVEGASKGGFEDFVAERWDEERMVKRIGDAYVEGVWEEYGGVLDAFKQLEGIAAEK